MESKKILRRILEECAKVRYGAKNLLDQHSELIICTTEDGLTKVDVTLENDTVWLSVAQMADLIQRDRSVISKHIKNIFEEGELLEESNVQNLHIANSDKPVKFYNLDVIISVGYRVKSQRGVQFRIWATNILKEYMKKGFAMDDERLKKMGGVIFRGSTHIKRS